MKCKIDKHLVLLFVVCVLVEVFLFNINSFKIWNKEKYEKKSYSVEQLGLKGFDYSEGILTYVPDWGQEPTLVIKDIDTCVGTIYLDLYTPDKDYVRYFVYYTDEANKYIKKNEYHEYIPGVDRTKWMICDFAGESDEIRIVFDFPEEVYQMVLNSCEINRTVDMQICIPRMIVLYLVMAGIYVSRRYSYWSGPMKKRSQSFILAAVVMGFIVLMWTFYVNSVEEFSLKREFGDIYNEQLVDSLIEGDVSIHPAVSDRISTLEDPYDTTERSIKGIEMYEDYLWDTAYYNGNFYVYFGVIPALLLFVPFKLLTGMYLSTGVATLLFLSIYICFLNALFVKCVKNVIPKTPFICYILGILTLSGGSLALCFANRAKFYEMSYASGLAFSAFGLYMLMAAYLKEHWNYWQIFIGGLSMAMAVGCRPTTVLYSFILVPPMIKRIHDTSVKEQIRPFLTLMAPYVVIAIGLMWYNYVRFDSPFDFGQNYQLTAVHVAKESYRIATLPWCIWIGMFQPFHINAGFPFVYSASNVTGFTGNFFNQAGTVPMFSAVPFLYTMFLPVMWRKWKMEKGTFAAIMQGTVIGLGWLMATLTFLSAGVCIRYTVEAIPLFMFAVLLLICNLLTTYDGIVKENLITIFLILTVFVFAVAFLTGMVGETDRIYVNHKEFYYAVERAFCFWK